MVRRQCQQLLSEFFRPVEHHIMATLDRNRPPTFRFRLIVELWKG